MKTNNNNPLPPELVEKMTEAWNKPNSVQECAQIAVDYAAENSFDSIASCAKLKQQRDELIECLKGVERMCDGENPAFENIWRIVYAQIQKYE